VVVEATSRLATVRFRKTGIAASVALAAITLTACGSSSKSAGSATPTTGTSAAASTAASTGSSAAATVNNKALTIGVAAITEASPVVPEQIATIQAAAKALGWSVKVLNANGNPSQEAADMSALVNQGVDAIINIAEQPAQVAQGLNAAKAKGIPVIAVGAPLIDPNHLTAVTYAPSDAQMADLLAAQMKTDFPSGASVLSLDASAIPAITARKTELLAKTTGTNIKVDTAHETDLANAVQDTQSAVSNALRANKNINMIWGLQDFEFSTSLQTLKSQNLGSKVGVYAFYLDPIDFDLLRAAKATGQKMAVADSPIQYSPWYAMDALVNKFTLSKSDWITDMSIKPLPYTLVTPANVQATGTTYAYEDFAPFFLNRWKTEGINIAS
jgi:ABC-type sugar transport system substrate-binding protein